MSDPIQEQFRARMNEIAAFLDGEFNGDVRPRRVCFALVIAEFGKAEGGRVNYISNGNREDNTAMLRELLARWEGRYIEGGTKQ